MKNRFIKLNNEWISFDKIEKFYIEDVIDYEINSRIYYIVCDTKFENEIKINKSNYRSSEEALQALDAFMNFGDYQYDNR